MPVAPKPVQEVEQLSAVPDPAQVREQLDRLVTHSLFANSKRYPALLAYVVEQTLLGNAGDLKERSIGIEVFGRAPTYDANADPVVRITAGEVRKRLSQYYYGYAHSRELVIELPVGSYVPVFHLPETAPEIVEPAPVFAPEPALPLSPSPAFEPTARASSPYPRLLWPLVVIVVALAGLAGADVGWHLHRPDPPPPPSAIDRFWQPFIASANPTTFCLGEPSMHLDLRSLDNYDVPVAAPQPDKLYERLQTSGRLALADVVTLTRTAAALEARQQAFRVVAASNASFAQLREGPVVLIGAFDNIWTLRITQKLRFGFESEDGSARIIDRKSPGTTSWATAWDLPYQRLARDYAIVARIHDHVTGQPVVIAAGISEEGTQAAGEILYNPLFLNSLLAHAPADWEQKNLEAVIETQVIQGHPGPPQVLAVETW